MNKRMLLSAGILCVFGLLALATSPKEGPPPPAPPATKTAPTKTPDPAAKPTPAVAPTDVALKTLLSEYKENQVRADDAFKDEVVRVKGHVWEVKKGLFDEIFVTLGPTKRWQLPMAACFVTDEAAAKRLNKGDAVTAEGRVDGLLVNVLLRDCSIR